MISCRAAGTLINKPSAPKKFLKLRGSAPNSPYYNADVLSRDVGIRFKGMEKTNVEEYCVSEGWVRVTAGNAKDRYGNPLTIKVHGPVEPYFRDKK